MNRQAASGWKTGWLGWEKRSAWFLFQLLWLACPQGTGSKGRTVGFSSDSRRCPGPCAGRVAVFSGRKQAGATWKVSNVETRKTHYIWCVGGLQATTGSVWEKTTLPGAGRIFWSHQAAGRAACALLRWAGGSARRGWMLHGRSSIGGRCGAICSHMPRARCAFARTGFSGAWASGKTPVRVAGGSGKTRT